MSAAAESMPIGVVNTGATAPMLVIGVSPQVADPSPSGVELLKTRLAQHLGVTLDQIEDLDINHPSCRHDRIPLLGLRLDFDHLTACEAVRKSHEVIDAIGDRVLGQSNAQSRQLKPAVALH